MFKRLHRSWLAVVASLLIASFSTLNAQTAGTGALTGTVTDASGAAIPNATVTATSNDTGQVRTTPTEASGTYRFSLLPPGDYKVSFSAEGFRAVEVPKVTIAVTETPVLNYALEVGAQTEKITVADSVESIQTASSALGTVVESKSVIALPLTTRNYTNLLGLSAGANASVPNATALGRGNMEIAVNGASTAQNTFLMDGVSVVNYASSGVQTESTTFATFGIPNPDTLQEFKIQTSLYDAGYGRNPGANVNVITKSGTNEFHGTAFEFFRNTDLNANDFFRNRTCGITPAVCASTGGNKLVLNQNQFGGVVGGPIKKDKLFFFASYQQTWQKNGIAAQGYSTGVNIPALPSGPRNTAAFKAALGAQYCGLATSAGGEKVACNGSNINPVALNLLNATLPNGSYYIPGSSTGTAQSVNYSNPAYDKEYQGMLNLDYIVNSKNTLSARYYNSVEPQLINFNASGGSAIPGTTTSDPFGYQTGLLRLTTIVTNNLVNELRGSTQRTTTDVSDTPPPSTAASNIIPGLAPGQSLLGGNLGFSPVVSITGMFSTGSTTSNESVHNLQKQIGDQVSWTHGKQSLRMGGEFERIDWAWDYQGLSRGIESFQTFQDFLIGLPGSCGAVSPTCNGGSLSNISNTQNYSVRSSPDGIIHGYRANDGNLFLQDDIKVSQRLTINAGLRWEYDGNVSDKYGNAVNLWTSAIQNGPVPVTTQLPTPGTYFQPTAGTYAGWVVPSNYSTTTYGPLPAGVINSGHLIASQSGVPLTNFAPRVGFAFQPTSSNRLVIRGGAGYFYDRVPGNTIIHAVEQSPPYAITLDQSGVGNAFASEAAPFQNIPVGSFPIRWVNFNGANAYQQSSGLAQTALYQSFVTPLVYSWNMNVQYEFLSGYVLELGYVGSRGIHQAEATHVINVPALATPGNPVNGVVTTNTVANAALRVPYLGFSPTGLQYAMTDGDYKSNGLQATVRKRLSHGLSFQAAYSWTRAFTTLNAAPTGTTGTPVGSNYNDPLTPTYGLNPQYRPQRLVVSYSYELPGSSLKGMAGKILGGWNIAGVTTIQDGQPLTIFDNRGGAIYGLSASGIVLSTAQMAAGATYANIASAGGVEARLGGASGGCGYFACTAPAAGGTITSATGYSAFTTIPIIGATSGIAGTGGTGFGNSGLGVVLGPGQFNFDATVGKTMRVGGIHEGATLQFRGEFYNLFNHPQFNNPASLNLNSSNFGQITATSVNPRLIQFALKYVF